MTDAVRAKVSANSTVANIYEVTRLDGSAFSDGAMVKTVRTIPNVALLLGCNDKTVRRAVKSDGIVKNQ